MKRFFALLAVAVLCVLAAPVTAPAAAATQTVMMQDYAYSPASLTVHVGDTVTWVQHDTAPHDVVTTSAPVAFRSPQLSQGQSWSYTFSTPGTYSYYCSVHPDMRAQVIVQPAPAAQPPPPPTRASAVAPASRPASAPSRTAVAAPPVAAAPPSSSTVASSVAPSQPVAAPASSAPVAQAAATTSIDPKLLVAGLVTAVAIGCLLLLTSRKA
ncbi:cupredoxin domain-containing protein [Amycolatopsis echigonensis]|uniref:Cupredoxin family copper-binding protein n=1 Tax=Amycolatopsis echigonensis TaxID=2576905 RepID=A0A8E2BAE5_9PSEU|nr:cupredoxin family copper-binding protein [Amycolatopsis echigonensis]MBB2506235.1 cupredoxin family copper-binding protein [Amycolatopsis echigonensis]